MKGINIIIAILIIMGISLETSQAVEEKRVKIFEMGESGQIIEFLISPAEIASEGAENAQLAVLRQARLNKPNERMKVIEMGDGQTVEFPMSPEEVASEDEENAPLSTLRKARFIKPQKPEVYFEMAESGIIIEFPERILEVNSASIGKLESL
jgi:hypothetical protein